MIEASPGGGRRARSWRWSRPRHELAAAGPAGLALGAAARRRPRPALRAGARASGDGRGARAARRRSRSSPRSSAPSMLIEEGDDVADVAAAVGAERGTTYVLIGQPPPRTGLAPLARVAARAADPKDARRRRADRRRPAREELGPEEADRMERGSCSRSWAPCSRADARGDPAPGQSQHATLMPAYIALVPRTLSLEAPLGASATARWLCSRRSSSARPARASRSTRGSCAVARRGRRSPS